MHHPVAKPFTYPREKLAPARPRSWRKPRKRRGLLRRRALGMIWHHPLLTGAALAATSWVLAAPRPQGATRVRRAGNEAIPVNDLPAEGAPSHG